MNQENYSYDPLTSKHWRAITYNYLGLASYGDTSRLYCLTDFQVAWLMSNVPYYNWHSRWYNDDYTQEELDREQAELEYALMTCLVFQPAQLSYLYDQAQQAELNALQALWDAGTQPSDVNPNTPDDYYDGDGSTDRENALCSACKIYIYSYAENWLAKASLGLGIAILVGLASSITIIGGVIASVLVGGLAYITSIAMDAMQDESALDRVVCCMNDALAGVAITQANFETALDACSFTVGSNEAIIRDIIASDLDQFGNWLSFINQIGDSYILAQAGVYDCIDCNTYINRLGGNGNADMAVIAWGGAPPYNTPIGFYDAGSDSYKSGQSVGNDYGLLKVTYTFPSPTLVNRIQLSSSLVVSRAGAGSNFTMSADGTPIYTEALATNATPHVYGVDFTTPTTVTTLTFAWACGGSVSVNGQAQFAPLIMTV